MAMALSIEHVSKTYPGAWKRAPVKAVQDVTLHVEQGETFGFIGPNGAGKSTLIKILVGAFSPTAGTVQIFGGDAKDPESRRGLGFVPENPSLPEFLTPYEILLMGLRLHRVQVENPRGHCLHWLERFDLAAVADTPLKGFSKGMMQRTALAHALAIRPRLLILDEPLSGLDPVGRSDVVNILDEYRKGQGTLFFSSHVLHDVERIADRFGLIHKGNLLTVKSPAEVVADQADRYLLRYRAANPLPDSVELRPGLFVLEVHVSDLSDAIARAVGCGGSIQDVLPKASLESVFFRAIANR